MGYYALSSQNQSCGGAVAPVKGSGPGEVIYMAGSGTMPTTLLQQTSGMPALNHDLTVENRSCYPATVTVTYLNGGECEPCTTDTVTTVEIVHQLAGYTGLNLDAPGVYVTRVDVALDADIPIGGEQAMLSAAGWAVAECPSCVKLVP